MQIIKHDTQFDFVGGRFKAYAFSAVLIIGSLLSLFVQGLNFGIDFSGGTLLQVRFAQVAPVHDMRLALETLGLGDVVIQEIGTPEEVLIRVEKVEEGKQKQQVDAIMAAINPLGGGTQPELRRVEFVGPQVGKELIEKGLLAVFYSMLAIMVYVWWRFDLAFGLGAVLALLHDPFIIVGYFSITQREFTMPVVAAVLTVIGYSVNDTIVVFDRIRDEMKRLKKQSMAVVINEAVNRTLSRTIVTSWTVVLVLIALVALGGPVIFDFAVALLLGVVIGTYSSIFVASPVVLALEKRVTAVPVRSGESNGEEVS